jgi:hypothetical protein
MAYLKFSRDKRGYEHFYLVQPTSRRGGQVRPRVLYWFRTPPNIRVGRQPFDPDVQRTLEARNPEVQFDWPTIVNTPIPPFDAEYWRERRRVEREARRASGESQAETIEPAEVPALAEPDGMPQESEQSSAPPAEAAAPPDGSEMPERPGGGRRRRRRRGRRGRGHPETAGASSQQTEPLGPASIQEVEPRVGTGTAEEPDEEIDGPTGEV